MQLIQLFPDRVGKFILDSVVDPIYWSDRPSYLGRSRALTDADAVYHAFTRVCAAAGPDKCSMLQPNETAEALDKRIRAVLNELYVKKDNATNRVSHYDATLRLFNLIDSDPSGWSTLVGRTSYLIPGLRPAEQTKRSLSEHPQQLTNGLEYMSPFSGPILPATHHLERRQDGPTIDETMTALSRWSIAKMAMICGDSADVKKYNTQTKDVFEEMIRSSREVSSMFSSIFSSQAFCHKWTSRAVERYTGPWSAKPKNPVLVVSAELDSSTPFRSAQLITTDSFLGTSARLVRIWNFGDSYESDSTCRQSAVFKYLNENVVPQDKGTDGEDVVCPTEFKILGTGVPSIFIGYFSIFIALYRTSTLGSGWRHQLSSGRQQPAWSQHTWRYREHSEHRGTRCRHCNTSKHRVCYLMLPFVFGCKANRWIIRTGVWS